MVVVQALTQKPFYKEGLNKFIFKITLITNSTSSDGILIRSAVWQDAHTVYDFVCQLEETRLDLACFQEVFRLNLANPMVHYLVAEQVGEVVGFVSCHVQHLLHHTGRVGEIQELFVRSDRRNQHIGQLLVAALTELAVREGFINLEVTTNQKRLDTVRFYERESFQRTHSKLVKPIVL